MILVSYSTELKCQLHFNLKTTKIHLTNKMLRSLDTADVLIAKQKTRTSVQQAMQKYKKQVQIFVEKIKIRENCLPWCRLIERERDREREKEKESESLFNRGV